MAPQDVLAKRLDYLKNNLPEKGVKFNEESPAWSQVQAALSRGDESVAPVLMDMKKLSLAEWKRAAEGNGLDIEYFVNTHWDTNQRLPWAVIDSGVGVERLGGELEKAVGKQKTSGF